MASDPESMPPGTVLLQDLHSFGDNKAEIILHPKPSSDPNDPLNWKTWEKSLNLGLVLLYTLIVAGLISASTPTWGPMSDELLFDYDTLNNSYAVGSATLAIGALIFIPLALKFGRRPIYLGSLLLQFGVGIWAANIQTVVDLMLVNAFNCLLGALAEVLVQMTIADVFFVHQRGVPTTVYVWVLTVGTSLAPVAAGYITTGLGWRWVWWIITILLGVSFLLFTFLYEETSFSLQYLNGSTSTQGYQDIGSVEMSAKNGDLETSDVLAQKPGSPGKLDLKRSDIERSASGVSVNTQPTARKTYLQKLKPWTSSPGSIASLAHHVYQPLVVVFTVPAVAYVALLFGMTTAGIQITLTVLSVYMVEEPYNFDASQIGLMSLPIFIGTSVGALLSGPVSDRIALIMSRRNKGIYEPEYRLYLLALFGPLIPVGLLMFGYGLADGKPWPIVAVGLGIYAMGITPVSGMSLIYVTDGYTDIVADAVVGITFVRNALATSFIFSLPPWIAVSGLKIVFLVLTIITIVILLSTIIFVLYGKKLRVWTTPRLKALAARQINVRDSSYFAQDL